MAMQGTISVIKSDAVAKNVIGDVYDCIEKLGLVVSAKMMRLSHDLVRAFFAVHKEHFFYNARADF